MKTRILGKEHAIEVSAIGYGCMGFSHGYDDCPDQNTAIDLIRLAYKKGCTFFDTAQSYAYGENEKLVGEAVKPFRNKVILATKIHLPDEAKANLEEHIEYIINQSLQRLQTDYIDLLYLHRINPAIPVEKVVEVFAKMIKNGKIKGYGLSQASAEEIRRANKIEPVTAVQSEYSIMEREFEKDVIPVCKELGIGFVAFSPMASGYLSGKHTAPNNSYTGDDVRRVITRYSAENVRANLPLLKLLDEWAERKHATSSQISLAWMLNKENFIVPIPGMRKIERVSENFNATEIEFTAEEFAEFENQLSEIKIYGNRTDEDIKKLKLLL